MNTCLTCQWKRAYLDDRFANVQICKLPRKRLLLPIAANWVYYSPLIQFEGQYPGQQETCSFWEQKEDEKLV